MEKHWQTFFVAFPFLRMNARSFKYELFAFWKCIIGARLPTGVFTSSCPWLYMCKSPWISFYQYVSSDQIVEVVIYLEEEVCMELRCD